MSFTALYLDPIKKKNLKNSLYIQKQGNFRVVIGIVSV